MRVEREMAELAPSRLYSFIDNDDNFAITFFEGQKLINDLVIINKLNSEGLSFLRDTLLSAQHIIQFFKNNEQMGFYIDSEEPKFNFKLEANTHGDLRTLLMPEELPQLPSKITGKVRTIKVTPGHKSPYQSIIEVNGNSLESSINKVLTQSYQVDAQVILSETTDQSIMVSKLPSSSLKSEKNKIFPSKSEYLNKHKDNFTEIFSSNITDEQEVIKRFEQLGLIYLRSIEINFKCPCSKDLMLANLATLIGTKDDDLFGAQKNHLEIKCDYCKKMYTISREDLNNVKVH